jgi:hypothetical protein
VHSTTVLVLPGTSASSTGTGTNTSSAGAVEEETLKSWGKCNNSASVAFLIGLVAVKFLLMSRVYMYDCFGLRSHDEVC